MTDGTRILRTLAVPLIVALIFLFLVPKTCQKAIGSKKLRPLGAAAKTAPTDTALHINSESPDGPSARPAAWPEGLDAQRVQYLIEIDPRFTEPMTVRIPKPGMIALDPAAGDALVRAGYFQASDGGYSPAPGSSLHLIGMSEEPNAWRVPLGVRKFGRVTSVDMDAEGRAKVGFTWQWEQNDAGRAVKETQELRTGRAEFVGGGGHAWDLTALSAGD